MYMTWTTEENHSMREMLDNVHDKFLTISVGTHDRHSSGQLGQKTYAFIPTT
jgi:hypothetical protein